MDFKLNLERRDTRIWLPREAERELRLRGYGSCYRRWVEGDNLIYPAVSPRAQLAWQLHRPLRRPTLERGLGSRRRLPHYRAQAAPDDASAGATATQLLPNSYPTLTLPITTP